MLATVVKDATAFNTKVKLIIFLSHSKAHGPVKREQGPGTRVTRDQGPMTRDQ